MAWRGRGTLLWGGTGWLIAECSVWTKVERTFLAWNLDCGTSCRSRDFVVKVFGALFYFLR